MDITEELEIIENRIWNNPALKASAMTIIFSMKALAEYADSFNKEIEDISPMELVENIIDIDNQTSF